MKAVDASRDTSGSFRPGGYSARDWAVDTLKQLPEDREEAMPLVREHTPCDTDHDKRRKVGKLCRAYYGRLDRTGLLAHGQRLLNQYS